MAIANDKAYQNTVKLTKGIAAAAQGAVQAATGASKTAAAPAAPAAAAAAAAPAAATPAAPAAAVGTATNQVRERYTRLTNKEIREIFAIAGGQLTEGPVLDKLKSFGTRLTTKQVSAADLEKSWKKSGNPPPDDSGIIADILKAGNVTDDVIQDIYTAMNIEVVTPAGRYRPPTAAATAGAATGTGTAGAATGTATQPAAVKSTTAAPVMDANRILKSYEMMTPEQRKQLIKDLEIIDDRDRLATGTNESRKRQRRIWI